MLGHHGGVEQREGLRTRVHGERVVYDNRWVRLALVDVEPPGGRRFEHHVVRLSAVAVAVVLDGDGRVLMLWRHRFVTGQWGWELPGGVVEAGEDPAAAARREVEEETGWRPGSLDVITRFQPMPGMVDAPHVLLRGTDATLVGAPTDVEEAAVVEWVPLDDVLRLVRDGELLGCGSLVGLLYVLAQRGTR